MADRCCGYACDIICFGMEIRFRAVFMDEESFSALQSHYRSLSDNGNYAGRCAMHLPDDLEGKRVLDVCCRKGKGVFELSDYTGDRGFLLGIDPDAANIEVARARAAENHWAGERWPAYMRFEQAWPEDLSVAGVRDASYDVVYVNSIINLFYDRIRALAEFHRVLVSGGRLWVAQGVFVSEDGGRRSDHCNENPPGSVFANAWTVGDFIHACALTGFSSVVCGDAAPIEPDCCLNADLPADTSYITCSLCARA